LTPTPGASTGWEGIRCGPTAHRTAYSMISAIDSHALPLKKQQLADIPDGRQNS
jgi:hypothetical protein